MYGYLIIFGDPSNPADLRLGTKVHRQLSNLSPSWRCCARKPGRFAAYVDTPSCENTGIVLPNNSGVIVGTIYPARTDDTCVTATPLNSISQRQFDALVQSEGRSLICGFWGHYVAALYYPDRSIGVVLRSPASSLPCFYTRIGTLHLVFSSLEDLMALKLFPLTINWDSITAQMIGGDFLTSETGFNEITTLECGESIGCNANGGYKRVYWDPHTYLRERSPISFPQAAREVRHVVDYSVDALSFSHESVLVNLSGGLDSSIVLSALSRSSSKPRMTSVNYYGSGCGDERYYARSMAQYARCRLIEIPRNINLDLHRFLDCRLTARPVLNFSAPDVDSRNAILARECGATAIFNGELGDNIFGRRPSPGVLVECLRHTGIRPKFVSVALDYAMLTHQSIWHAMRLSFRERKSIVQGNDFNAWKRIQERYGENEASSLTLTSAEAERHAAAMGGRFLHPWLRQARSIAPGSNNLLFGLIVVTSPLFHPAFAARMDPPHISPFLTQPVIESLLRIPGYLHCHNAQDRAVARAAFSDALPPEVLNRGLGKGGPDLWAKSVIENNLAFIREFLFDGILAERGLLDRNKLDIVLSPTIAKSTAMVGDIFAKLYMEAWLTKASQFVGPLYDTHVDR